MYLPLNLIVFLLCVESFYLMVGSYYYLWSKSDWVYTSVFESMRQNKLAKLLQAEGFDMGRVETMRSYVTQLENQLQIIKKGNVINATPASQ